MTQYNANAPLKPWLKRSTETVLGLGLAALVMLACMQVVLRYFFDNSVPWMEEISVLILLGMVWLCAIPLWIDGSHIALDILAQRLGPRGRALLELCLNLLLLLLAAGLARSSLDTYAAVANLDLAASELPVAVLYYPLTASAIGLMFAALYGAWRAIAALRDAP